MIVPSIDLMGGNAVQLIGGKEMELDAGSPMPIAEKFRLAGDIAVIDLDAALGKGSNDKTIEQLVGMAKCRVGGGIRTIDRAIDLLDIGASQIIIGTKATPEFLQQLPKQRLIAALDAVHGEVVVEGWQSATGHRVEDKMKELTPYVDGFLVTFVEREGRMKGVSLEEIEKLTKCAGNAKLTIAGGVTTLDEIAAIDALGVDAQIGMALYKGHVSLGDCIAAPLIANSSSPNELWPTIVCDESQRTLGLCWSNRESLNKAVELQRGVYHSRKRGLWIKGETSGATQELLSISLDCDRDALRFTVKQTPPGFCHKETDSCFGNLTGLAALEKTLTARKLNAPEKSYTKRLFSEPDLLKAKILEEANELCEAKTKEDIIWEAADLIYFALAKLATNDISLAEVEKVLDRRALKVTRRPGNAKS